MYRSLILLLAMFAISWISTPALGNDFSTRRPGYDIDDEIDDLNDNEDEPELLISSVLVTPYLMRRESGEAQLTEGEFEGVIPDLLKAMCDTGHMNCDYDIELATDNIFGSRDYQGRWNGMIGEVKRAEVDFAAAPISITDERAAVVNFSIPFAEIAITVVVNENDGISSIEDLLANKNITLGGLQNGRSVNTLRSQAQPPYATMWSKLDSKEDSRVASVQEGIDRVLKGGYAFLCETDTARYYVNRHCRLDQIQDTFLPGKGHALAFPKDNENLELHINTALRMLKHEKKIEKIYNKWFDATCGASTMNPFRGIFVIALSMLLLL